MSLGTRREVVIAMDWTNFDHDDQSTLMLSLIDAHGKAVPLVWLSMWKHELKDQMNDIEDTCLRRLHECLPAGIKITITADRGFGDCELYALLQEFSFDYIIRFRDNIKVTSDHGEAKLAQDWIKPGQARKLTNPSVTAREQPVPAIVFLRDKAMKEAWCLATSRQDLGAREIAGMYGKRWRIETGFRDTKDLRFGMGLRAVRLKDPERRDRLLLLNAFATFFLILLGVAAEATGMDKRLRCGTSKKRTHSLFRQGCILFDLIPTMREEWLGPLIKKFNELLCDEDFFQPILHVS
jgi:hypothetical protein